MHLFKTPLALAALLVASVAAADPPAAAGQKLPSFDTSASCESIEGYDPQWARHGEQYGRGLNADKGYFVSGFYQLTGHGERLYAAFGGVLTDGRQPVKGVTPGALAVLNADTLKLERFIPLPFHAHSLLVRPALNRVVVTHTRANAFSLVDLATGQVRCVKPDAGQGPNEFRGRYVTGDEQGNFYLSYHAGRGDQAQSLVAKYDRDAKPAAGYTPKVTEPGMSLPALYRAGQVITGSQSASTVDASTGQVRRLLPRNAGWNIYNYAPGPGQTLLATNYKDDGSPNLLWIDPASNGVSAILTGRDSLEATYVPEAAQVFTTNFGSGTVSVAELAASGGALQPRGFVNIALRGKPLGLYARRTAQGTEVFVTPKWDGDVVQKIVIAPTVRGIQGIAQPGACTVATFDLADRSVSAAQPCRVLDAKASYAAEQALLQTAIQEVEQELRADQAKLAQAQAALQKAERDKTPAAARATQRKAVADLQEAVRDGQQALRDSTASRDLFARLAAQ